MDAPIVTSDGEHTITKLESDNPDALKCIRIRRDEEWTYYVFYRAVCTSGLACNGAMITLAKDSNFFKDGDHSANTRLLNVNWNASHSCPSSPEPCAACVPSCGGSGSSGVGNWCNAVLPESATYFDDGSTTPTPIAITVLDVSANTITVDVDFGGTNGSITSQPAINEQPIIDILSPAQGAILSGTIDFTVWADDPSPNETITKIKLSIPTIPTTYQQTFEPPSQPEVTWEFDTEAAGLTNGPYALFVEVHSSGNAAPRKLRFDFFLDNGGCP
jgi:hypothetical protein